MALLDKLNVMAKIAIPLAMIAALVVGLVTYAHMALGSMSLQAQTTIGVQAKRLEHVLRVGMGVAEVTLLNRNTILETDVPAMRTYIARQDKWRAATLTSLDTLIGLANTEERRAANLRLKAQVEQFFGSIWRSNERALLSDDAGAKAIAWGEAQPVRRTISEAVEKRIEGNVRELAEARDIAAETSAQATLRLTVAATVGLLAAVGLATAIIIVGVTRPLRRMTRSMGALAAGDLGIPVEGVARRDEIGALARALAVFKQNAAEADRLAAAQSVDEAAKARRVERLDQLTRRFEGEAGSLTQGLSGAATEMEATAHTMAGIADQTKEQVTHVAAAAGQTSANVQTVAAATEELAASIQEIAVQVTHSAAIAARAVASARDTDARIQALSEAADRIGAVVAMIANIADQTNMLALNATIEAARAGDTGRGFAVVASEVKALAAQTSRATDEIAAQIDAIQGATRDAVDSVRGIGETITGMADIATQVAAAMEEQGSATREIARNVQEAARGTEVVTGNIGNVRAGASETGTAASQVLEAARSLAGQSDTLGRSVRSFLTEVHAA